VEQNQTIPVREMERMMKLQDVILKAMAGKITWIDAAEIAGMSVRNMQRKRQAYIDYGYTGLADHRRGKTSYHRVPMETAERVLRLYQDKYFDLNVRHFHEKLREAEGIELSYSWVKQALQGAGLVVKRRKRGPHRRRRPRRPLPGMLLHIDGSKHAWFQDNRYFDLIVILDDATSEIYYAQLVDEESTRTVMAAVREVIEQKGLFCALYSDRGSHFFYTPKAGEQVDKSRLTQFGRALKELGIQMIAAYSPPARADGAQLWHLAGAPAAGTSPGWNHGDGRGESISPRPLHCRVQLEVHNRGDGARNSFPSYGARRSGLDLFGADRASGRQG
jgi:transposase